MVNSNDGDNGVIVGRYILTLQPLTMSPLDPLQMSPTMSNFKRWDGKYDKGTEPFKWTGSVRILEEYMAAGGRPVRYIYGNWG